MIYRKFQDIQLSGLGLGMMRLPVLGGNDGAVDEAAAAKMIDYAYKNGINYFDTAWGYHDGNSELVAGKYLSAYPRESYYLASKFPGYDLSNMGKVEEIFERQLEKCRTGYFDFYLFHNVYEGNIDAYLNPQYGILEYLLKQKENGRICHLGFSAHGSVEVIRHFLEAYGQHMEFCQLQLNYMDWHFQNAMEKAEIIQKSGIPIWVMEPLRGGKLAKASGELSAAMQSLRPEETVPGWAFRFLQSIPGVTVMLSGMSDLEQLKANIITSIGIASSEGKAHIHSGGTGGSMWGGDQDAFLESMAEAGKSVVDYLGGNILYINVMNRLSVDCDCDGNPSV